MGADWCLDEQLLGGDVWSPSSEYPFWNPFLVDVDPLEIGGWSLPYWRDLFSSPRGLVGGSPELENGGQLVQR